MPELPEVERARQLLHMRCINKEITWVRAVDDSIVFPEQRGHSLALKLKGRRVIDTGRRGKHFWLMLSGGLNLFLHFGMSGDIHVSDEARTRYRKVDVDVGGAWPPLYTKLEMEFGKDLAVAFTDPRRLGRIRIFEGDALQAPVIQKLGFDPVLNPPCFEDFRQMVLKRRSPIKALLLNQSFSAGIGNWIADEVLYQSKVHPSQPACTLSDLQIRLLLERIRTVCVTAVEANADSERFPADWLFHHRWSKARSKSKSKSKSSQQTLPNGLSIDFVTVGGRTSAFVPDVQVLAPSDVSPSDTEVEEEEDRVPPPNPSPTVRKPTIIRRKFGLKRATVCEE
ncbi:hypothetical protein LPJ64_002112 [Coemansia asiatica]|uniref:Formamidopyrimidine-DNA glycosylase catalytic domain-containing protein n=1 Tax=Coemansia asiatica TaxID=1052880 RepID=A0A9W7XNM7_9FUNG|nr:hypothetical protein LPJ64_002112 [Coemansia asiatica]KAJ2888634.1 hypothetical protein FB639_000507 [Coemansia asiatica]